MFRNLMGSEPIDLQKTKFDPENAGHKAALKARIDSFNGALSVLMKTDVVITVPVAASVLLWLSGNFSFLLEVILLAACAATLWAADELNQRTEQYRHYQEKLSELICIYKKCIADHGYQITADEMILKLLQTIAPYVNTHQLWIVSSENPMTYPDGFKTILAKAPHRVPFGESKAEAPHAFIAAATNLVGLTSTVSVPSPITLQQQAGGTMKLFQRVAAEVTLAVYGLDERKIATLK